MNRIRIDSSLSGVQRTLGLNLCPDVGIFAVLWTGKAVDPT
jgi:hypothetical protein